MKNMKKALCLLTLVPFSLALLAGCGSSDNTMGEGDTAQINDGYGTLTRNGDHTLVGVCHDREAIYLYNYEEEDELLGTAEIPEEIYDEDWDLFQFSFYDYDDDGSSDLQVTLSHDMSESYLHWTWVEDEGYVFVWEESEFYHSIALRYPDDNDSENAFLDAIYRYVGVWLSDGDDPYDDAYIEIDWNGYWILYAAGEIVDEGRIQLNPDGDCLSSESDEDSAINGSRVEVEGDRLSITGLGSFTHLVPENDSEDGDSL